MKLTTKPYTVLHIVYICTIVCSMQLNATQIIIRSYSETSHFAPYHDLEHKNSKFILDTVAQSKPYLWIGSDKSLLRSIQSDNLIVCFEDENPIGFLSYHTLIIPPYGIPYCEACNALKDSQKPKVSIFVGHIHILAIKKDARGKGYGTLLVKQALKQINALGRSKNMLPIIGIAVNPKNEPAIHLYTKKFGFENLNVLIHKGVHWVLKQPHNNDQSSVSSTEYSWILFTGLGAFFVIIALFIIYRRRKKRS